MTSLGASAGWGLVVAASLIMGALVASRITLPERVAAPITALGAACSSPRSPWNWCRERTNRQGLGSPPSGCCSGPVPSSVPTPVVSGRVGQKRASLDPRRRRTSMPRPTVNTPAIDDSTGHRDLCLYLLARDERMVVVRTTRRSAMKALVYHGPGQKAWEDVAEARRSSTTPTRSCASTPPRSAAPICTSSRVTSPR